jgi:phage I-like protein
MTHKRPQTFAAAMAALDLPQAGEVPEWIHLLPTAAGEVRTYDGRGPYKIADAAAVIAASFSTDPRDEAALIVDENHATMLAAPKGLPSPSRGKITQMEARADGIWGRVDWNPSGAALMADRAYRGISPVVIHDAQGQVLRIKNASLVNYPNLRGLAALHQETAMNWANIAKALGLADDASEEQILAAIEKMKKPAGDAAAAALQASLAEIGTALGVEGGDTAAIIAAAQAKKGATPAELAALQSELVATTTRLNEVIKGAKQDKAARFVDDAIAAGRVGVKPQRDRFIAQHMENPGETEAFINGLPALGAGGQVVPAQPAGGEITALNAEQIAVADVLGISHEDYLATLKAENKQGGK